MRTDETSLERATRLYKTAVASIEAMDSFLKGYMLAVTSQREEQETDWFNFVSKRYKVMSNAVFFLGEQLAFEKENDDDPSLSTWLESHRSTQERHYRQGIESHHDISSFITGFKSAIASNSTTSTQVDRTVKAAPSQTEWCKYVEDHCMKIMWAIFVLGEQLEDDE